MIFFFFIFKYQKAPRSLGVGVTYSICCFWGVGGRLSCRGLWDVERVHLGVVFGVIRLLTASRASAYTTFLCFSSPRFSFFSHGRQLRQGLPPESHEVSLVAIASKRNWVLLKSRRFLLFHRVPIWRRRVGDGITRKQMGPLMRRMARGSAKTRGELPVTAISRDKNTSNVYHDFLPRRIKVLFRTRYIT